MSYLEQINLAIECNPKTILYVGVGNGLVPNYLSKMYEVTTLDIDNELSPDICCNVLNLDNRVYKNYDLIMCCQVLEHLNYNDFEFILTEFKEIANKNVILSLPDSRYYFRFEFKFNRKEIGCEFSMPFSKRYNNVHKWEIGWERISVKEIRNKIKKHFTIVKEYGLFEDPYYRFYLLEV